MISLLKFHKIIHKFELDLMFYKTKLQCFDVKRDLQITGVKFQPFDGGSGAQDVNRVIQAIGLSGTTFMNLLKSV